MSILDRDALSASPLADLHALASELSIDGYRRLRKDDLIDAIIARQGGSPAEEVADQEDREATDEADGQKDREAADEAAGQEDREATDEAAGQEDREAR